MSWLELQPQNTVWLLVWAQAFAWLGCTVYPLELGFLMAPAPLATVGMREDEERGLGNSPFRTNCPHP